ncbi:hypothetical protein B6U74_02310 [Candidatus Bathyarchaeota archaeon ex4484_205]|nr:MAG: hypothetical protein B6U74_02310 [Candidatus Bathyarchaeota archaeon ex4484_205]RLG67787.1 MAG: hypothetical protein DRN93_03900 [archaeon]
MTIIQAFSLRKCYGNLEALKNINLQIEESELHGLVGPNGAGKTTLLKLIAGVLKPTSGEVKVLGLPAGHPQTYHKLSFLPEYLNFPRHLTGREALLFYSDLYDIPRPDALRRIDELSSQMGLEEALDRHISSYSRGMLQRLGLIYAFLNDPEVVLLDEPATGLDPTYRMKLKELLKRKSREKRTILISSHVLSELENLVDSLTIISKGQIIASGGREEVIRRFSPYNLLFIELNKLPTEKFLRELEKISGVSDIKVDGRNIVVRLPYDDDVREEISRTIYTLRFLPLSITMRKISLEEVYLKAVGEKH